MLVQEREDCDRVYIGRVVHSKSLKNLEILPHAALGVRKDGRIAFLQATDQNASIDAICASHGFQSSQTIHLTPSQFIFPGLIDTHLHAPQWPNLALGMEGDLREWVEGWTDPMEASYSSTHQAKTVYPDVVKTTLRLGSTTVAYNTTIHAEATNILAKAAYDAGQRAIVGKMCVTTGSTHGNWEDSTEQSLADSQKCLDYISNLDPTSRLIHPCTQPRGGPFCPPDLMSGLGKQTSAGGKGTTYVQCHMCETPDDIQRTLSLHPGSSCYSDMYLSHNLLTRKSIMAHCIHLTPTDISNLRETGAGVAHNPNSNTCLRDGECRVRDLLSAGIHVGLGTDCSAGYMPSIHEGMRAASNVSRHLAVHTGEEKYILGFEELVYLATMGGADVLDMQGEIGNFEAGKKFDALIVDVKDVISVTKEMWKEGSGRDEDIVKKWGFLGDDRTIRKVFVDGKLVAGHDVQEK